MNISALTAKEVLRMCDPVTDLEKRLFDLVSELQDEVSDLEDSPSIAECDCCSSGDCDDCEEKLSSIEDAIELIESGKVDEGVKKLKGIS